MKWTGEQGYVDDERSCVWTWDDNECAWQSRPFKGRQVNRRRGKGKGKHRGRSKRTGRALFGDEQAQDPEWWQEEDLVWRSKERKARQARQRCRQGISPRQRQRKGSQRKMQGRNLTSIRILSLRNTNEEGYGHAWESDAWSASHWTDDSWTPDAGWFCTKAHTAWMVATPLNLANHPTHVVLNLGCTRSIRSRAAIERFKKHAWYYGITTEVCRCNKSFVFANSETETCKESCIIHFPTIPPCSTMVDVLETVRDGICVDPPLCRGTSQGKYGSKTIDLVCQGHKDV